jgi:hypothetical protein
MFPVKGAAEEIEASAEGSAEAADGEGERVG